jgi:hypothetical protein
LLDKDAGVGVKDGRLILVELNEINFDIVDRYLDDKPAAFPAFRKLVSGPRVRTTSEREYENLEPWIQWPSVHSGLSLEEHRVFRLGDMASRDVPQVFEQLERAGFRVGAISAMNAANRLQNPAYFIPDPWTCTPSDGTWWSRVLTSAIAQVVNDNSQARITFRSACHLAMGLARFAQPRHYAMYLKLFMRLRKAPWRKALLLDLFLHDLHVKLFRRKSPNFSVLFVNAGAHIQHHYFLNSRRVMQELRMRNPAWYVSAKEDPFADMLEVYDLILRQYEMMDDVDLIVATGLSQRPYDRVKFYYRLTDHAGFLRTVGVRFKAVAPRMTRDFLIEFENSVDAATAEGILKGLVIAGSADPLFGEIDNRGSSLFVTLTYPQEIDESTRILVGGVPRLLAPHVVFVAVKNGMHQAEGFAFFKGGVANYAPPDGAHVKELHSTVLKFFDNAGATVYSLGCK